MPQYRCAACVYILYMAGHKYRHMLNAVRSFVANVRGAMLPLLPSDSVVQSRRYCAKLTNELDERTRCVRLCVCVCVVFRGVEGGQHEAVSPFAPLYAWIPLNSGATAWSQCRPYPCPGRPFACQTVSALSAFIEFHYSFMSVRRERAVRNVIIKGRLHARTPLPLSPPSTWLVCPVLAAWPK